MNYILVLFASPLIITLLICLFTFKNEWKRKQMLIAYDQLVNTWFNGWADETISSRMYRRSLQTPCLNCQWPKKLIDSIFFLDPDHCKHSFYSEKERMQLPPSLRGTKK